MAAVSSPRKGLPVVALIIPARIYHRCSSQYAVAHQSCLSLKFVCAWGHSYQGKNYIILNTSANLIRSSVARMKDSSVWSIQTWCTYLMMQVLYLQQHKESHQAEVRNNLHLTKCFKNRPPIKRFIKHYCSLHSLKLQRDSMWRALHMVWRALVKHTLCLATDQRKVSLICALWVSKAVNLQ